ncbi:putative maleylacetoacetate isomerase [Madurella mycetomatis]|uniref:Maleylacetoacetate isomerase n=1 Tax=Madurella mycetomatis TaxID=100816 RepID=A0A175W268_9PEZI|nr:putative maleylacetoacetate isomerase [Madurella mycetomatis]
MSYRLYITNKNYSSWSLRPWLLMRQLGIPFAEDLRPLVSGSYRQPQWRAFSPVAHVPCLHVLQPDLPSADVSAGAGTGAEPPIVLWESLAIVEFLAEEHPDKAVYPADRAARAWARSAVAEMHAGFAAMRQEMGMNVGVRIELSGSAFTEGLARDLERLDELWREGLARFGGPFLAGGEFTAVDAFYAPVVLRLVSYLGALERMGGGGQGVREED